MNTSELLLIDLSAIGHQIWHVSGSEPDPSYVSTQIIARVRSLAASHPHAAICCDSGKSFRAEIDPTYKANRDTENRAPLRHQMDVACQALKRDGFPVWAIKGFEADDLIATAVAKAADIDETSVLIVTADKDLFQLVTDRVAVKSIITGNVIDAAAVREKFKVTPAQMHDYLCLVGDTSDNIVGAKGIGGVTAAKLLSEHGSLAALYEKMARDVVPGVTPAMRTSLMEFKDRWTTVAKLIALRADAPIPFEEIAAEREAAPMVEEPSMEDTEHDTFNAVMHAASAPREDTVSSAPNAASVAAMDDFTKNMPVSSPQRTNGAVVGEVQCVQNMGRDTYTPTAPVDYSQQLEPRSIAEAKQLAQMMFDSRMFSQFGTPQAVLAIVLAGRELGMGALKSLRSFHSIDNRPCMSADLIAGQVLASGKAKYFKPINRSATVATFKTLRIGEDEEPFELKYTIEEAKLAWKKDQRAWDASGWGKNPADMLVARCKSKLARLVYPDVVSGLYAPEEMD